jgi:hypothetical protein
MPSDMCILGGLICHGHPIGVNIFFLLVVTCDIKSSHEASFEEGAPFLNIV